MWLTGPRAPRRRDATLDELGVGRVRGPLVGATRVSPDSALTHSAVWAACRIRADVVASLPVRAYIARPGGRAATDPPAFFAQPTGIDLAPDAEDWTWPEWAWARQWDLDRVGVFGAVITHRDKTRRPRALAPIGERDLSLTVRGPRILEARAYGDVLPLEDLWLETLYRPSGSPVGLSAVMHAARTIGSAVSAQQAAADHWAAGLRPAGILRNTSYRRVDPSQIDAAQEKFRAAVERGGLFVSGRDWEWTPVQVEGVQETLLDELRWSIADVARFMGIPSDLLDGAQSGTTVTYQNLSDRALQFLTYHLGALLHRAEARWSRDLCDPSVSVSLDADALLRMDPTQRTDLLVRQVGAALVTNSEAREILDRPALTGQDIADHHALYGAPRTTPMTGGVAP